LSCALLYCRHWQSCSRIVSARNFELLLHKCVRCPKHTLNQVCYPTCPPPIDPDASKEGVEKRLWDVPVGVGRIGEGRTGAVASVIEKLEKSRGVLKESIVTR
jgi:hypothetical protein